MMLRVSLDMPECASDIEKAVSEVLEAGYRTADIYSEGTKKVGTTKMGDLVLEALK
jgi:3-isopropylmalate dehydrogenase